MPVDVLPVRDDDIPALVQEDICDLGIVGMNIIEERRLGFEADGVAPIFEQVTALDFGHCRLSFGIPRAFDYQGPPSINGLRIATTYPRIVKDYLQREGIDAAVVSFSGAVEIAPSLGKSDIICDLVSSGSTLKAHDLYEAETILESRAALIKTPVAVPEAKTVWMNRLLQRVQGVLQVRESKYIMLHAPRSALKEITALLPGSEAPTIMPLEGRDDKVAVHAVCRENVFWETLEQLKEAGASSMLVLPVEKMLA
jgi:ATP phosphoribosyltransferase